MKVYDLIIVGGGASGLLCAIEAKKLGVQDILIIEKDNILGGALSTSDFNISKNLEITGQKYKEHLLQKFNDYSFDIKLNTMVLKIENDNEVICTSFENGIERIKGKNIILANGAKEGSRKAVDMVGSRCSGIYTVGMAKKIFAMENMIPGKKILIDADDTLYMIQRQLKQHNLEIVGIISDKEEVETYGLTKNIYRGYKIASIEGQGRVNKVILKNELNKELEVNCDTVLFAKPMLSDGLVAMRSGITLNPLTTGPKVDENYMTSKDRVYACGNGIFIHKYIEDIEEECIELVNKLYNKK